MARIINVKEWMSTPVITISSEMTVLDAAKLMDKHVIGSLPVVDSQKPVGILTERDIIRRVISKGLDSAKIKIKDCMTKDIIAIDEDAGLMKISQLMHKNYFRRLIIIKRGKVVGIITAKDLIRILSQG